MKELILLFNFLPFAGYSPNTGEEYPPTLRAFPFTPSSTSLPIKIISKYNFHFFLAALLSLSAAFCLRDSTSPATVNANVSSAPRHSTFSRRDTHEDRYRFGSVFLKQEQHEQFR
ncbi:hypothetical protein ABDX87_04130 [Pseudomonas abietaniphila]|uniref:hypothetical protein n=1 Tax=Pseudomonas abietaniphila TaxID=89065 RepID=UPI0032164416